MFDVLRGEAMKIPSSAWILVYLVYITLVNMLPEAGYIALLVGITFLKRNSSFLKGRNLEAGQVAQFLALSLLLQPYPYINSIRTPLPASIIFSIIVVLAEEYFFRGIILLIVGNPLQAFLFALTHLAFTDPIYLVNTLSLIHI